MRLKTLKLTNFRGYRSLTIPFEAALTGVVGRNDYGKSTILEALDIFFESGAVKPDRSDMNCFALAEGGSHFEIACEFEDVQPLILDSSVETTLEQEYLLNENRALEIVKRYKASTGKLDGVAIRCLHPADPPFNNLLSKKIGELRNIARELNATVEDERVSSLFRKAIRQAGGDLRIQETLLDVEKGFSGDSKEIWSKIESQLPTYALFKADRESNDDDAEAKNPLQQAVKEAQAELEGEIRDLERRVEERVLEVASRTLEKLREMAPDLASELNPRFKEKPKWTFNFTLDGENGIPINKRGSGVRRLILLNFFRAEAEKAAGTNRAVIYAIEEPETSQHPNYQIMLMKALLSLAEQPNRQIIVTTHVPALAGLIPVEGIRFVTRNEVGQPVVKLPSDDVLREVANSLGVLPETGMERARAVILVEGHQDVIFLRHASRVLKEAGYLSNSLDDKKIVPIPMGGCGSIKHWVTLKLADSLGVPWCVFVDSDNGGSSNNIEKRRQEVESLGKKFYVTRKREIENYLCPELIRDLTGAEVTYTDTCDAKAIINAATKVRKDDVIGRFWPSMTAEKIRSMSAYRDGGVQRYELQEILSEMLELVSDG